MQSNLIIELSDSDNPSYVYTEDDFNFFLLSQAMPIKEKSRFMSYISRSGMTSVLNGKRYANIEDPIFVIEEGTKVTMSDGLDRYKVEKDFFTERELLPKVEDFIRCYSDYQVTYLVFKNKMAVEGNYMRVRINDVKLLGYVAAI